MRARIRIAAALAALMALAFSGLAAYSGSSASGQVYVVQPGDSLWAISQRTGVPIPELASANDMSPNDILLIPSMDRLASYSPPQPASQPALAPLGSYAPSAFCSQYAPQGGSQGQLPPLLAGLPTRLALEPLMDHWAARFGVPVALLEAVDWQESGWQQDVVSPSGAIGIGQIEPATATFVSQALIGQALDVWSTSDNIEMSAAMLAYLYRLEGGNVCRTVAAYYEGASNLAWYGVLPSAQWYVADVEALETQFS